jgi:hypothetical protein
LGRAPLACLRLSVLPSWELSIIGNPLHDITAKLYGAVLWMKKRKVDKRRAARQSESVRGVRTTTTFESPPGRSTDSPIVGPGLEPHERKREDEQGRDQCRERPAARRQAAARPLAVEDRSHAILESIWPRHRQRGAGRHLASLRGGQNFDEVRGIPGRGHACLEDQVVAGLLAFDA